MADLARFGDPSELRCLVYTSLATRKYEDKELQAILQRSRFNNSRDLISGMLLYVKGMFFQMLEGPHEKVEATYRRIGLDPRHRKVTTIKDCPIKERHFPQWTMGFPTPNAAQFARFFGYSDLSKTGSEDLARLKSHHSGLFQIMVELSQSAKAARAN